MEFIRECSTQYREIPYLQATFIIYHVYAIYQAQTFAIHHVLLSWDVIYISR